MSRRTLLILAPLLACACAPRWRGAASRELSAFPRLDVRLDVAEPRVRHDLSLAEIERLPEAPRRKRTQALTLIRRSMSLHRGYSAESGDGAVSAWLDDVEVTLSLSPVSIFIPKEYAEGSCEYKALLRHETEHVRVAAWLAAAAARRLRGALAGAIDLPSQAKPVTAAGHAEAISALKDAVDRLVDPLYAGFEAELARKQAERDEPADYARLFGRCSDWRDADLARVP